VLPLRIQLFLPVLAGLLVAFLVIAVGSRAALPYAFFAALGAGGAAAWLTAMRVSARLRALEEASATIVSGIVDPREARFPGDELGALERRLTELARDFRSQYARTAEERERLEAVLRNMLDGVVVLGADGRIALANAAATDLLGIPPLVELLGARLALLCRNPDLVGVIDELLGPRPRPLTRDVVLDGPERRFLSVAAAPIELSGGLGGAILVLHDVTRVRRLESMRADFVANVSHELRTPLTAIRGYAETLLGGALDDRARALQFLQVIERHSERLSRLIEDLLTLSDLELGRTELHPEPFELAGIVEGVLEVLQPKAEGKGIDLRMDVPESLPAVLVDRDQIEQVLINLIDNAIKYTPAGGRVRVSAAARDSEDRGAVEIRVVDSGIGIPEKDIPRLTERFFRVDRARSRELGGTGLGLAIVKHIVQAHGGSLAIESRPQHGTTVRVGLPQAATDGASSLSH
jgi:two-component system, OmpR family, phosphate regulon sensor histidine kinase PhoR